MGYYVTLEQSTWTIDHNHFDEALRALKDLNRPENNHLKRGGSYSGGGQREWWFSWMPADYDKTVTSVKEVFELLGFDTHIEDSGDLVLTAYSNKTGQEDLFLDAVAPWSTGATEWVGEDGESWVYAAVDGRMQTFEGKRVYYPRS